LGEKRRLKRSLCYLDVIEQTSGNFMGTATNIHHEGMMLVSMFQPALFLDVPIWVEDPNIKDKIPLVINGIWSQMNMHPVSYYTGCRIVDPSPEAICEINGLIEEITQ
jgi:hypothetical protein